MFCNTVLGFTALTAINLATATISWATGPGSLDAAAVSRTPANRLILAQAQAPHATEAILRKTIQDMQQGHPDFDSMELALQNAVKQQSEATADIYRHLGALQTLKYVATRDGADVYRAVYQNAAVTYIIRLSASGKISVLVLQPAFPW
jgi:hypothetical protein